MKTSKFLAFGTAFGKALTEIAKAMKAAGGGDIQKQMNARSVALMENIPGVTTALNDLLLNPSADDIAMISMQTAFACKVAILNQTPEDRARTGNSELYKELETTVQRYLKYKAEKVAGKKELIALIDANTPK